MLFHYGIRGNAIKYNYDRNEVVVKPRGERANLGAPVVSQQQL
jgi:hypothetical protein